MLETTLWMFNEELDDVYTLYYDMTTNMMVNENGFEVFNVFSVITPNTLMLFKARQKDMIVRGVTGQLIELVWPDEEEDPD